jgi:mono/diheme cytochrome c family protein
VQVIKPPGCPQIEALNTWEEDMESRTSRYGMTAFAALLLAFGGSTCAQAQAHDPGVRTDVDPRIGDTYLDLSKDPSNPLTILFHDGQKAFNESENIDDGLGPRMNLDSCLGCHANPAAGGSSPKDNPQFVFLNGLNQTTNKLPPFITKDGPVREARFKQIFENGRPVGPDGGVHDLFTIARMKGAEDCKLPQPDFEEELSHNNVIFRIPTPVFGAGLIEQIPDQAIIDNLNTEVEQKKRLGISFRVNVVVSANTVTTQNFRTEHPKPNKNGNDGTIARFGWKAQNKSLLIFSGEAYNVEMGISNELFQTEREEDPNCQFKPTPNDTTNPAKNGLEILSDMEKFASFMRLLAPPEPSNDVPGAAPGSIAHGNTVFGDVGCALCHAPMLKTGKSTIPQLSEKKVNLYSDLAIHHMGAKLDDGIQQGQAAHDQFRTAPLWGLGKRIFFLHDGRTKDLVTAIEEHHSRDTISFRCWFLSKFFSQLLCGPNDGTVASEANAVVENYNKLPEKDKQDLLNFLRSL